MPLAQAAYKVGPKTEPCITPLVTFVDPLT